MRTAVAAFACQLVVPAGYMPAAIADGSPFALCGGLTGGQHAATGIHDGSHVDGAHEHFDHSMGSGSAEDGQPASHAWEYCPLGILSASAAPISSFDLDIEAVRHRFERPVSETAPLRRSASWFRSRAPPVTETVQSMT